MGIRSVAVEGERPCRAVLLCLFWEFGKPTFRMTSLEAVLGVLLLAAGALALVLYRRCLALQRKYKTLQRLYEKAEQQLSSLWTSRRV